LRGEESFFFASAAEVNGIGRGYVACDMSGEELRWF
jgi:hypothetical protein